MPPHRRILVALARTAADEELLRYAGLLGAPGVEFFHVHITPAEGSREDGLLKAAIKHQADLLLLGHGKDRRGHRSLARRMAMKAPCSVWMAPEGSPASISRILVPVDFSSMAADALHIATEVAKSLQLVKVTALHVYFDSAVTSDEESDEEMRSEEDIRFLRFLGKVDLSGVEVDTMYEQGPSAAHAIRRIAEERRFDLIVMGSRGRSLSAAVLLGSETDETMRQTRVPVLAVKHFGARMNLLNALLDERLRERETPRFG